MDSFTYFGLLKKGMKLSASMGLNNFIFGNQNKSQMLDPLSTIIRLAIIAYKPLGTKLCISNNKLYIQNPSLIQGTIRTINGSHKNDIQYLKDPIERACNTFLSSKKNDNILWIFFKAKEGLLMLKDTYGEWPIIIHCLDLYVKLIENAIKGEDEQNKFNPETDNNLEECDLDEANADMKIRSELYDKFISMWTENQITIVYSLLYELDRASAKQKNKEYSYNKDCLFNSIEAFLCQGDKRTKDIIESFTI
jgi:hypothetical protein